jgi:plastocyanin
MMRDGSAGGRSRWCLAVLGSALLVVFGGTSLVTAAAPAATLKVDIKQHKYSPDTLTIPVGTTVTWVNHDDDVHTVVSSAQAFMSRGIDNEESYSYTFTKPGTYVYFCTLHPLMTAKVIVK